MSSVAELEVEKDEGEVIRCAACQAPLAFDPAAGGLKCAYCGARVEIPRDGALPSHPLVEGLKVRPRPHLATQKRVVCRNCGAASVVAADHVSLQCIFCLAPLTLASEAAELAEFDAIAPFKLDNAAAKTAFKRWLRGVWFAPNALARLSKLEKVRATYVPIWRFSAHVHSDWTAKVGLMEGEEGHEHFVPKRTVKGVHEADYQDLFVGGSTVLDPDPVFWPSLRTTAGRAVAFDRGYLAGFDAELPCIALEAAWGKAQEKIHKDEVFACGDLVQKGEGADETHEIEVTTAPRDGSYRLTLVPLYIIAYRYKKKLFRVLINGQNGIGEGDHPWSWLKLSPVIAAVTAGLLYAAYLIWGS